MAQTRESRLRPPTHMAQAARNAHSHYLIVGLAIGGLWLLNRESLLYHAVQMLAVMSVLTVLQIVLRRHAGKKVPYVRLIAPKLVLVGLAVGGEWLVAPVTSRSNGIVAAGLVVVVTVLGPVLDRLAAKRATPANEPTRPTSDPPACAAQSPSHPATFRPDPGFTEGENP
jgi:hypothetical protein